MSLAPSRPIEELDDQLAAQGFRPASPGVLDPGEVDFCRTLHCQRCREAEPECRAYERESGARPEACAVAVCRRCAAAEVLPRSRPLLLLRRADEHAGISAAAAVAGIAGLLALAGIVSGGALQGVLVALAALPVAFLGYLARNGPGGGEAAGPQI